MRELGYFEDDTALIELVTSACRRNEGVGDDESNRISFQRESPVPVGGMRELGLRIAKEAFPEFDVTSACRRNEGVGGMLELVQRHSGGSHQCLSAE